MNIKAIKTSMIYNLFTFAFIKKKKFIYKKELYVIMMFIIKYNYLCKHLYFSIIIYIDYKSLIHFLSSNFYEKIYNY